MLAVTTTDVTTAAATSGNTLTKLYGAGYLKAGKILARVGDIAPPPRSPLPGGDPATEIRDSG